MGCAAVGKEAILGRVRVEAEQQARPVGDHGVGARALVVRPGFADFDRVGRMDLVDCRQPRTGQDGFNRAAAILLDGLAIVIGAVADIEACNQAPRYPAAPAEEAMRHARKRVRANDLDVVNQGCG